MKSTNAGLSERGADASPFNQFGFSTQQDAPTAFNWSLHDICWALCCFRRRGVLFFGATVVLVTLGLVVCPRVYRSEAQLFVRLGRENATLDPTATTGPVVGINVTRDSEIKSIIEVMSSRQLVERVVEQIGFEEPVASELGREKKVTSMMEDIHVWSPRQTTIIGVSAKARSPERARDIVKTLVDVYLDEHLRLNRTPGAYEFFDKQTDLLRNELASASRELGDLKSKFSLASIEGRRKALQEQTSAVETQLLETSSAISTSLARIKAMQAALKLLPSQMLKHFAGQSDAANKMQETLHLLQAREQELLAKYSVRHPAVIAIHQQVHEVQRLLAVEQPDRQQAEIGVLLQEEANYQSLQARDKTLTNQLAQLQNNIHVLNAQEVEVKELERNVRVAETNYLTHVKGLQETRVDQALQEAEISNISVVQHANLARKPISPKKGLTLALTLVVATVGSIAIALLSAQLDHTLTTRREIEHWLDAPLLVSIPCTNVDSMTIGHILSDSGP